MVAVSRSAEVTRILERYLVEVVERHELCPWARAARERGEIAVAILWAAPAVDAWVTEAERLLAAPATRVAMVVAPEAPMSRPALAALRDEMAARIPSAGVAEFHPDAALDLATPARLVPFLRRSPDPMLQLVPLELLDRVRTYPAVVDLTEQAHMLRDLAAPSRGDVADAIADANHARVTAHAQQIAATLDDIAADRRRSYARVRIAINTAR